MHGRLDLFTDLVSRIRSDSDSRIPKKTRIILIGDIVDRGPDAASLVERLRALSTQRGGLVILRGNHEDIMIDALRGDLEALENWLKFGGDSTLRSWGVAQALIEGPLPELLAAAHETIPRETIDWLDGLPLSFRSGDYFFVHAGVRPGVSLKRQESDDLLWIGSEFLESQADHSAIIVHGHSIFEDGPEFHSNRIAIDTGAYRTGKLCAVGFEDSEQWVLST